MQIIFLETQGNLLFFIFIFWTWGHQVKFEQILNQIFNYTLLSAIRIAKKFNCIYQGSEVASLSMMPFCRLTSQKCFLVSTQILSRIRQIALAPIFFLDRVKTTSDVSQSTQPNSVSTSLLLSLLMCAGSFFSQRMLSKKLSTFLPTFWNVSKK